MSDRGSSLAEGRLPAAALEENPFDQLHPIHTERHVVGLLRLLGGLEVESKSFSHRDQQFALPRLVCRRHRFVVIIEHEASMNLGRIYQRVCLFCLTPSSTAPCAGAFA